MLYFIVLLAANVAVIVTSLHLVNLQNAEQALYFLQIALDLSLFLIRLNVLY